MFSTAGAAGAFVDINFNDCPFRRCVSFSLSVRGRPPNHLHSIELARSAQPRASPRPPSEQRLPRCFEGAKRKAVREKNSRRFGVYDRVSVWLAMRERERETGGAPAEEWTGRWEAFVFPLVARSPGAHQRLFSHSVLASALSSSSY